MEGRRRRRRGDGLPLDGPRDAFGAGGRGPRARGRGPRLSFFFNVHNNFIEEVAKFRAARTLGASTTYTFLHVTLPLARRGIVAGAVLAFARSLGEFGATLMIAGSIPGETRTIPLHIHEYLDSPGGWPRAAPLVLVSVALACGATWLGERASGPPAAPGPAPM